MIQLANFTSVNSKRSVKSIITKLIKKYGLEETRSVQGVARTRKSQLK